MKQAKSEALAQQLVDLRELHQRRVNRSNHTLMLAGDILSEADTQYNVAVQAHLQNLDTLVDLHSRRIQDLESHHSLQVAELEADFGGERAQLTALHARERGALLGVIRRCDMDHTDGEADARHEYQSAKDDIRNKNLEEKHALRISLEGAVEDLWRQFQAALSAYSAATDERRRVFEELKAKDAICANTIEGQLRKLARLADAVASYKSRLVGTAREKEVVLTGLRSKKEEVVAALSVLKRRMARYRESEQRRLIDLTRLASRVAHSLEAKVTMAHAILKFAEMNAKLETSDERLIWAVTRDLPKPIPDETQEVETNDHLVPTTAIVLQRFQSRYNKVLLDKLALEADREKLSNENASLRAVLQAYLEGISVRDSTLDAPNPLMVINGRANVLLCVSWCN
jgi:DNA-binding protein H-NS